MADKPDGTRRRRFEAACIVLIPLYVGSYFTLLEQSDDYVFVDQNPETGVSLLDIEPRYSVSYVDTLFYPLNQVDRMLRPLHWRRTIYPPPWLRRGRGKINTT